MKRYQFLLGFLLCNVALLNGQDIFTVQRDTIFLQVDADENAFFEQQLLPGMTLYQISRKHKIALSTLLRTNPGLKIDEMPIGTPIKVLFQPETQMQVECASADQIPFFYKVKPKDNLFRISKVYLKSSVKEIKELNALEKNSLDIGQLILVGYNRVDAADHTILKSDTSITLSEVEGPSQTQILSQADSLNGGNVAHQLLDSLSLVADTIQNLRSPIDAYLEEKEIVYNDKGLAFWNKDHNEQKNLFVLHKRARRRSLIEITNPMNGRTVYAKVVGDIPSKAYTSDIEMVVSPAVAKTLGVLDSRFYITYRYIE